MQSNVQTLASDLLSLLTFYNPSLRQIFLPSPLKTRISCYSSIIHKEQKFSSEIRRILVMAYLLQS